MSLRRAVRRQGPWRLQAALWLLVLSSAAVLLLPAWYRYRAAAAPSAAVAASSSSAAAPPGLRPSARHVGVVAAASVPGEAARQRAVLAGILAHEYSRERPLTQAAGRPPIVFAPEAGAAAGDGGDDDSRAAFCARGAAFFAALPHAAGCEICDEHAHASRYLFERFFAHSSWRRGGVYVESGALDGENGAQSLFFDEVLRWRGLLIEGNPVNFARAMARRPRAARLECALCAADGGEVEFVGDHGGVAGVAAAMGDELRGAFHGDRADRYNVSCCALRTAWPAAALGRRIDLWFLDVEGSEAAALRSVDWQATDVWLILVEMNPAAGADRLQETRGELAARGFALVTTQGAMNELWENRAHRPLGAGLPADEAPCDWGEHPPPYDGKELK